MMLQKYLMEFLNHVLPDQNLSFKEIPVEKGFQAMVMNINRKIFPILLIKIINEIFLECKKYLERINYF